MEKTIYIINGHRVRVINRNANVVSYVTEHDVKCRVGVKWFTAHINT